MSIINALKTSLVTRLTGDATLTSLVGGTAVFDSLAPENTSPPFIVFQRLVTVPVYTFGQRAFDTNQVMIKGITRGGSRALGGSIAERIDVLLDDAPLTITGGATNLYLRRSSDIDYPETDNGVVYHHIGATYTIWVQ